MHVTRPYRLRAYRQRQLSFRITRLIAPLIAALFSLTPFSLAQAPAEPVPATPPAPEAAAPPAGPSVGARAAAIADWIPERERIWLGETPADTAGESTARQPAAGDPAPDEAATAAAATPPMAAPEPFFARQQRDLSGQPRGSLLIVPDAGQHPAWPEIVAALFDQLPRHGWHALAPSLPPPATLSVSALPPQPEVDSSAAEPAAETTPTAATTPATGPATADSQKPPRAEKAEEDIESDAETVPPPTDAIARERLHIALAHLSQQGDDGGIVAIGIGHGALRVARLVATEPAAFVGVVLINAGAAQALEPELTELLSRLELPVLDLLAAPSATDRAVIKERARKLLAHASYQQVMLPAPVTAVAGLESRHDAIVRRVRGWLERQIGPR